MPVVPVLTVMELLEDAADFFNRGYKNEVYFDAVRRIHKAAPGIHVVTHVMFGLPCGDVPEPSEQMMDSVRAVVAAGSDKKRILNDLNKLLQN